MLEWLFLAAFGRPAPGSLLAPLRVLRYPTFRTAMATVTAFLVCVLLGPRVISLLKRLRVGDRPDQCPSAEIGALHRAKADTPTMGGAFVVPAVIATALLWARQDFYVVLAVFTLLGFALLGAVDDLTKLLRPGARGIGVPAKLLGQCTLALCAAAALHGHTVAEEGLTTLQLPFLKRLGIDLGAAGGIPYVLLAAFVIVSASNAVNLTDGLDGLAAGLLAPVAIALGVIAFAAGDATLSRYLYIAHVPGAREAMVLCGALLGAALGFLWFNAHPARVFMGDTGSLPLGAALGLLAVVVRHEILLVLLAGAFVAEALSVLVQVAAFRMSGRRVFRCAPLHHHFQLGGLPETVVTTRFWIAGVLLMLLSLATLKVR